MARKYQWNKDKYRAIVAGDKSLGIEGLRSIVKGFDAKDGYSVKDVDSWSAYQKRKVREVFHRIELLQAQPKRMVRARGDNLRKLQDAFHGDIPSKDFKVAFIPDTEPALTMPGAKKHPPKIRMLKEGVSIQRNEYERVFVPFDQKSLAKNAMKEIQRVAAQVPDATLYYVQVGEYQTLNGKSINLVIKQVLNWMQQYDGKKALPQSSGNRGDDPRHHHWKKWLNGLVGYRLPRHVDIRKVAKIIKEGRSKNAALVAKRRLYMKRQSRKGRK
jgi:hypothetical protein